MTVDLDLFVEAHAAILPTIGFRALGEPSARLTGRTAAL
jgi:hypothetical protein